MVEGDQQVKQLLKRLLILVALHELWKKR